MIHMGVARHGYVGLVRTSDGNLHVAAAVDPVALRSDGGPEPLINRILRDAGMSTLSGLAAHACRGTLPLTRSSGRLVDNRIFLLGDAAGYVEPFTGEGMGWAHGLGRLGRPVCHAHVARLGCRRAHGMGTAQRRQMARGQLACRVLSGLLRSPLVVDLALGAAGGPGRGRPIVRRIHAGRAPVETSLL